MAAALLQPQREAVSSLMQPIRTPGWQPRLAAFASWLLPRLCRPDMPEAGCCVPAALHAVPTCLGIPTPPDGPAGSWCRLDAPFGTEDNPVVVPSEFSERIVGVNDPDDDSLVGTGPGGG